MNPFVAWGDRIVLAIVVRMERHIEAQIKGLEEKMSEGFAALEAKIAALQAEVAESSAKADETLTAVNDMAGDVTSLQAVVADLQAQLAAAGAGGEGMSAAETASALALVDSALSATTALKEKMVSLAGTAQADAALEPPPQG